MSIYVFKYQYVSKIFAIITFTSYNIKVMRSPDREGQPSEGENKKRVPFSMRANKVYFEREVIHLEKKLASLEQIEHIISQAA